LTPLDIVEFSVYGLLAIALTLLCLLSSNLLWLATTFWRHQSQGQSLANQAPAAVLNEEDLPRVLIQIPIFNERHVVRRILGATAALDWPADKLTIQLLDDSIDETREIAEAAVQELRAAGVDAHRLHRVDRTGFKAGALHAGLGVTDHPYVAMFDADFIPRPDFLRRTVGVLENDKRLAFVQGRWDHLNGDENRLTRAQTLMLDAHFGVEQPARSMTGLPLPFNGTCGIWRRAAIDDAGGWKADTLTEDLDLSLRAHLKGWRARYLSDITVPGELPSSIAAWRVQQFRWTKGFAQVACKLLPTIWRSDLPRKAKVAVSLQLLQCLFYPLAAVALINTLMFLGIGFDQPVCLTVLGLCSTVLGIAGTVAFLVSGRCAVRRDRLSRVAMDMLATMALNAGLSLSNSRGVIEAFIGRRSGFVRTPKKGSSRRSGYASGAGSGIPETAAGVVLLGMVVTDLAWYLPFLAVSGTGLLIMGGALLAERYDLRLDPRRLPASLPGVKLAPPTPAAAPQPTTRS
jgi:cellulose synthase/poly-beta-1,6-N-acetylglucosamine synthase-like glycosyltransferase